MCSIDLLDDHINTSTVYGTASEHTYRGEDEDLLVFDDPEDNTEMWNSLGQQDSSDETEGVLYFSVDDLMNDSSCDNIPEPCSKQIELGDGFVLEFMYSDDEDQEKHDDSYHKIDGQQHTDACSSDTCEYSITIELEDERDEFNSQPSWLLDDIITSTFVIKYTREEMLSLEGNMETYYHEDGLAAGNRVYELIAKGKKEAKSERSRRNNSYQSKRRENEDTERCNESELNTTKVNISCVPTRQPKNPDEQQTGFYHDGKGNNKVSVKYIRCSACKHIVCLDCKQYYV